MFDPTILSSLKKGEAHCCNAWDTAWQNDCCSSRFQAHWHSIKKHQVFKHLSGHQKQHVNHCHVMFFKVFVWFQTIWICQNLTKKKHTLQGTSGCEFVDWPRLRGRFQSPPASCKTSAKMQSNPKRPRQHRIHLMNSKKRGPPKKKTGWLLDLGDGFVVGDGKKFCPSYMRDFI